MKSSKWSKKQYGASIIAIVSTLLFLFPVFWMFITSIKPMGDLFAYPPELIPKNPSFDAYIDNFVKNQEMFKYIGNSAVIATGTMLLTLVLAAPCAYALARQNIKGKAFILIILLSIQMLPNIMLAMPLFILFSKLNLINSYTALFIANTTHALPFAILVLRPYFLSLPGGLEEAAQIDGCNKLSAFWRIILPLVKPGLLTVGAFCFLWGWGDFLFALTLTSDESIRPLTLGLYKFIGEYGTEWNKLMAVATIAAIPIILIFVTLQKYIVSGVTSGAMKD
ncbi:MAG TPA: carbohydrate ABC transporter permease [Bacillus sp. (in: firmicutes)]|nr:carbohydrate ABC transporter permease [Bacillus sp. (in: firmicutes)]